MSAKHPVPEVQDLLGHAAWLRRLVAPLLGDAHAVEDVLQETWLAAIERPLRQEAHAQSFLASIAARRAQRWRRCTARRRQREAQVAREERLAPVDELVATVEIEARLAARLLALPASHRDALLLRFYEGLPPRAIAHKLCAPVATVKTWIRRGLERLAQDLERELGPAWRGALAPLAWPISLAGPSVGSSATALLLLGGVAMNVKLALGFVCAATVAAWLWFANDASSDREQAAPAANILTSSDGPARALPSEAITASTVTRDEIPHVEAQPELADEASAAMPRSLRVEVRDPRGERVPEAVVELILVTRQETGESSGGLGTYRRAHDAPASAIEIPVEDLEEAFSSLRSAGSESYIALQARVLGSEASRYRLASAAVPNEPVELRVGPIGRVVVEVLDAEGRTFSEKAQVTLRAAAPGIPREDERIWIRVSGERRDLSNGRAVFACVALGRLLRAEVCDHEEQFVTSNVVAAGPLNAGEEITLRASLRDTIPVLFGRFLDETGAPLKKREVTVFAEIGRARIGDQFTTDAEGRFELPWREILRRRAPFDALLFHLGAELDPASVTQLRPAPTVPPTGRVDLGTLTLRTPALPQLLAAGTVVDADGNPLAEVEISGLAVWPLNPTGPFEEQRELHCETVRTGPDGSFRLMGIDRCRGVRIMARLANYDQAEALFAERGREDLRLVLLRGGALSGNVLLDPEVPPSAIDVEFASEQDRVLATGKLRPDGRFALLGLLRTRGQLSLRRGGLQLLRIEDLEPAASDAAVNPRLVDLDLRARLRPFAFRVVDDQGEAIANARFAFIGGANGVITVGLDPTGRGSTWLPRELEAFEVGLQGFSPRHIAWTAEEPLVHFDAHHVARFRRDPTLALPESILLEIATRTPEGAALTPLERRILSTQPEALPAGGELRLTLPRPGRYELHLWVRDPVARRSAHIEGRDLEIEERAGVMEVLVEADPAKLRAALEKLRR